MTHSRRIVLIDGLGALLSTVFLSIIMQFEDSFGMPRSILTFLLAGTCLFTLYSFSVYFMEPHNWRFYLKTIATANSLYCCLTLGLVVYCYERLTLLGLVYFLLEIVVIVALVSLELRVLANNGQEKS
jgi:hypothetical protein